jgi:hypothetical protein
MARTKPPKKAPQKDFNGPFPLQDDEIFLSLTPGRQKFVYNYYLKPVSKWSNGRCYSRAFGHEEIKPSHYVEANRLLKAPKIQHCIDKLKKSFVRSLEISKERILQEEACLAYSDIALLFDDKGHLNVNPKDLPEDIRRAISSMKVSYDLKGEPVYEFKLWDKGKALQRIENIKGMNAPQKHLLGNDPDNPLPDPAQHQEQLLSLLLQMASRIPDGSNLPHPGRPEKEGPVQDEWEGSDQLSDPAGILRASSYNEEIETMTLIFEDGKVVEYLDFPEHLYETFLQAKNPSSFFSRRIDGNYEFNMISEDERMVG